MKVREALIVIAIVAAWVAGSVGIMNTLLTPQRLAMLERIPWLVPLLNGLLLCVFGYILCRSCRTMLRAILARHPQRILIWLGLWGGIMSVSTVRRAPHATITLANWLLVSGLFVLVSSCTMLLLDENWHTPARSRQLFIATLSVCAALLVVIGL